MEDRALIATIARHLARGNEVIAANSLAIDRNAAAMDRNAAAMDRNSEVIVDLRQFSNELILRVDGATKRLEGTLNGLAAAVRAQADATGELVKRADRHEEALFQILDELRRRRDGTP